MEVTVATTATNNMNNLSNTYHESNICNFYASRQITSIMAAAAAAAAAAVTPTAVTAELKYFPLHFKEFLSFYEVLDKSYAFLTKHHIRCTIAKLRELCSQLLQLTSPSCFTNNDAKDGNDAESSSSNSEVLPLPPLSFASFSSICSSGSASTASSSSAASSSSTQLRIEREHIAQLTWLAPNDFQLIDSEKDDFVCELRCATHPAASASHCKARRLAIVNSLWTCLATAYLKSLSPTKEEGGVVEPSPVDVEACIKAGKRKGFGSFDLSQVQLPFVADGSISMAGKGLTSSTDENTHITAADSNDPTLSYGGPFLDMLTKIKGFPFYKNQIKHIVCYPCSPAILQELEKPLPKPIYDCLSRLGIQCFYRHQAKAINAIRCGKNVIISTSTSSGKSIIYNVPVIESILEESSSTALYLFPTKALSQDQLRAMIDLVGSDQTNVVPLVCDGDTKLSDRIAIQNGLGNVIITNPDMLHHTILPDHKQWKRIFQNLRFVVIDEAHQYSGAFGSHVACLLKRLIRICLYYGSSPQFILCSATISNPEEHARRLVPVQLLGRGLEVVTNVEDGAPHGERAFLIWNPYKRSSNSQGPPITSETIEKDTEILDIFQATDALTVKTSSPIIEAASIFSALVTLNQRTIAFCGTRKLVELVFKYSNRNLEQWGKQELLDLITSYRGGYTDYDRRDIESRLFNNELLGVVATSALELGIDVGSLDVTLHMGFPGTFSSLWQQAGRAGRNTRPSMAIILCYDSPLDQYFANNPKILLESGFESAVLDVENVHILKSHISCAAKEIPLNFEFLSNQCAITDINIWGSKYMDIVKILIDSCKVREFRTSSKQKLQADEMPLLRYWSSGSGSNEAAKEVNLRMIDPVTISVLNESQEVMDSVEYSRAFYELFEGAIVMHRGRQFVVTKLDLLSNCAFTKQVNVQYYTSAKNQTLINVVKLIENDGLFNYGIVQVVSKVIGYFKRKLISGEIFDEGSCSLPPLEYETTAIWIDIPLGLKTELETSGICCAEAIHACNHLLVGISPMLGQCDPSDIGTEHIASVDTREHPFRVMLFDKRPGGLGSCAALFTFRKQILLSALKILEDCACSNGCPGCILDKRCSSHNKYLSKLGAKLLLTHFLNHFIEKMDNTSNNNNNNNKRTAQDKFSYSPNKRTKHLELQKASMRESARSKALSVQTQWTLTSQDFQGES